MNVNLTAKYQKLPLNTLSGRGYYEVSQSKSGDISEKIENNTNSNTKQISSNSVISLKNTHY